MLLYLGCFLFSWSNPEVEAIERGSIQLACSSHTCLKTNPSVCSRQTVMLPQSWTGWKQSHLSKLAAQSLQTPKLLIHKKRKGALKKPWSDLQALVLLSLSQQTRHTLFAILHPAPKITMDLLVLTKSHTCHLIVPCQLCQPGLLLGRPVWPRTTWTSTSSPPSCWGIARPAVAQSYMMYCTT